MKKEDGRKREILRESTTEKFALKGIENVNSLVIGKGHSRT